MKIGTYTIPLYRLEPLLNDTKKTYDTFKNQEFKAEDLAALLQQKHTSGGFKQKLADMRSYGLLDGRGNGIKVSKLWIDAIYGTEDESKQAYEKMVRSVPLWSTLLDKYGTSIKEDQFWVILRQITGVESPEAQEAANKTRKAYMEDVRYIKPVERHQEQIVSGPSPKNLSDDTSGVQTKLPNDRNMNMETMQGQPLIQQNSSNTYVEIKYPGYSFKTDITDESSLDDAQQFIEMLRKRIIKQKQTVQKEVTQYTEDTKTLV